MFNTQLSDLSEKLQASFPGNRYIEKLNMAVAFTTSAIGNPFRLMVEFYNYVYIPYGDRLLKAKTVEDCEGFFLESNSISESLKEQHAKVESIIDTLRALWRSLDAGEKKSMFSYLRALLLLTQLHIKEKGLLQGMSSDPPITYVPPPSPVAVVPPAAAAAVAASSSSAPAAAVAAASSSAPAAAAAADELPPAPTPVKRKPSLEDDEQEQNKKHIPEAQGMILAKEKEDDARSEE
jgi:hypothetical protein